MRWHLAWSTTWMASSWSWSSYWEPRRNSRTVKSLEAVQWVMQNVVTVSRRPVSKGSAVSPGRTLKGRRLSYQKVTESAEVCHAWIQMSTWSLARGSQIRALVPGKPLETTFAMLLTVFSNFPEPIHEGLGKKRHKSNWPLSKVLVASLRFKPGLQLQSVDAQITCIILHAWHTGRSPRFCRNQTHFYLQVHQLHLNFHLEPSPTGITTFVYSLVLTIVTSVFLWEPRERMTLQPSIPTYIYFKYSKPGLTTTGSVN